MILDRLLKIKLINYKMLRNVLRGKINLINLARVNIYKKPLCLMSMDCTHNGRPDSNGELIRHNFHKDCEGGLNQQINCELFASYTYFCMANCLSRPDTAFLGYAKFFYKSSAEEQEHAKKLVDFVNMRGGRVQLSDVKTPEYKYNGVDDVLEKSILLEKTVLQNLEELHKTAVSHNDIVLTDFLESQFIMEQHKGLQLLAGMLTNVKRAGNSEGLILLDLELLKHIPQMH